MNTRRLLAAFSLVVLVSFGVMRLLGINAPYTTKQTRSSYWPFLSDILHNLVISFLIIVKMDFFCEENF